MLLDEGSKSAQPGAELHGLMHREQAPHSHVLSAVWGGRTFVCSQAQACPGDPGPSSDARLRRRSSVNSGRVADEKLYGAFQAGAVAPRTWLAELPSSPDIAEVYTWWGRERATIACFKSAFATDTTKQGHGHGRHGIRLRFLT